MAIKTLHITNAWHPTSGGISTFYRALMQTANQLGRPMRLVVPSERNRIEEVGEFGRIHHVASPRAPLFDKRYRLLLPHTYMPFWRGAVERILEEEKPDLVEICDKYAVSWLAGLIRRGLTRGSRRPVLVGMSCERMDDNVRAFITEADTAKRLTRLYLGNIYIPLFDYHIANSPYTADELIAAMNPAHTRPVEWRPMGADVSAFSSAAPDESVRKRLLRICGGKPSTKILLYAGRLSPEKNLSLLLDLIERLAGDGDYRMVIAGDGPLADWMRRESRMRLNGRIALLGHVGDRRELIDLYSNADVFVHSNPHEPFGIAPLEAMATGIPLVGPRSGGLLAYADETNSWLARPAGEDMAAAVRSIFTDPAVRKDKLARARWVARQHSWPLVAPQFFALYDELFLDFPTTRFARRFCGTEQKLPPARMAEEKT